MDSSLVIVIMSCLIFAVALNLLLTFRLAAIVRGVPSQQSVSQGLPTGEIIPDFYGIKLSDGKVVSSKNIKNQPLVLLFLSPKCKDCIGKLPEISQIQKATKDAGVLMWLVGTDRERRIRKFLNNSGLFDCYVKMESASFKRLNPRNASPSYLFIDGEKTLQAKGFIGDENWLSFLTQMHEPESGSVQ